MRTLIKSCSNVNSYSAIGQQQQVAQRCFSRSFPDVCTLDDNLLYPFLSRSSTISSFFRLLMINSSLTTAKINRILLLSLFSCHCAVWTSKTANCYMPTCKIYFDPLIYSICTILPGVHMLVVPQEVMPFVCCTAQSEL